MLVLLTLLSQSPERVLRPGIAWDWARIRSKGKALFSDQRVERWAFSLWITGSPHKLWAQLPHWISTMGRKKRAGAEFSQRTHSCAVPTPDRSVSSPGQWCPSCITGPRAALLLHTICQAEVWGAAILYLNSGLRIQVNSSSKYWWGFCTQHPMSKQN